MDRKELEFTRMVKEQKNNIYTVCMMFAVGVRLVRIREQLKNM